MNVREVLFYVLSTGCQWQALTKDLLPKSTAHHYFGLWNWDGTLARIQKSITRSRPNTYDDEIVTACAILAQKAGSLLQVYIGECRGYNS